MDANPFEVLGLTPAILRGLNDTQVKGLVDSQYRALAAIHHPDRGGDRERFQLVTEAFAILNQPVEREENRKFYLKPRKGLLAKQAAATRAAAAQGEVLAGRLISFWRAAVGVDAVAPDSLRVFGLANVCLLVRRTLINTLRTPRTPGRVFAPSPTGSICELVVGSHGELALYPLRSTKYDARRAQPPAGTLSHHVHEGKVPWMSTYQTRMPRQDLPGVQIVATVSNALRQELYPSGGPSVRDLLTGRIEEGFELAENGFGWDQIERFVPLFSPYIRVDDELIGMATDDGPSRFIFLGQVIKAWRLSKKEANVVALVPVSS